jgi:hypothetical protein
MNFTQPYSNIYKFSRIATIPEDVKAELLLRIRKFLQAT